MRNDQIGAVREMAPESLAELAERILRSGERDVFIHDEQLLYLARLAIPHGGPVPVGPVDRDVIGRLMLGVNDLLGREAEETPEQLGIHLALRRMGALRNAQPRYLIGRYHDLLVTRARAYSGQPPKLDLDAAFKASIGLTLGDDTAFAPMYIQPFINVNDLQRPGGPGLPERAPALREPRSRPRRWRGSRGSSSAPTSPGSTTRSLAPPTTLGSRPSCRSSSGRSSGCSAAPCCRSRTGCSWRRPPRGLTAVMVDLLLALLEEAQVTAAPE
jgi:hypothetical protein